MEGGMVAVVQGLKDAGLAVTLLSPRHPGRAVAGVGAMPVYPAQACQTVQDTATDTAAPVRPMDEMYRSSYQMAHCQPSGCSPVRPPHHPLQEFHQYRSSTSRSPDEEAFVESLRKYPISPIRSRSADLIERMLSYTHSKNGSRYSNSRSAKSLPSKKATKNVHLHADEIPTRDTGIAAKDLKPNFGYKRDLELVPVSTSNRKSRYDEIGMYDYLKSIHKDKKLKGSEVRYLTNVKQCLRERLRQICDEEPVSVCPEIQNRYSQHRKKYHRAEGSQKSQKVNDCKNLEKCPTCQDSMIQASPENDIQISPSTSKEPKESRINKSLSAFKHSKACFCDRPGPCDCGAQSRLILKSKLPEYLGTDFNKHKSISICEHECNINSKEDIHIRQLEEVILKWSQELPVYSNFNTADAIKREEIINNLINRSKQLKRDNTFVEKVEDEIKRCIKDLPMWRPLNTQDQEAFENQLILTLLEKIRSVLDEKNEFKDEISKWVDSIPFTRDSIDKEAIVNQIIDKLKPVTVSRPLSDKDYKAALKSEIANTLNDLPIDFYGSRSTVINNIADKLAEKLYTLPIQQPVEPKQLDIKTVVLDWIKDIPEISNNLITDDVLVNDLIMRLNNLQNEEADEKQNQMNDVITDWLDYVEEKKKCQIDRNTKNTLTNQLIGKIINELPLSQPRENVNNIVQKWFNNIQDTLGLTYIDNQKDLETLVTALQDIQNIENNQNRQNTMRHEIVKWLQNLQGRHSRHVENGIQENFVNKLISMIEGEPTLVNNSWENGLITQNIWDWLESQPEFRQDNSLQYRDMVVELSEKLQDIKDTKGELTQNDIKTEVTSWFEKLSKERGIQIETDSQKKLQDKLFSAISPGQRRKTWEKPINNQDIISKEVSNIMNDFVLPLDEVDKGQVKEHITKTITENWNAIQSKKTHEPILKIKNILKQATNLPETEINSMAHTLVKKIKDTKLPNLNEVVQEGPLVLDDKVKDKLKSKIEYTFKILPMKDKNLVIDRINDILIKSYEEVKNEIEFEVIYELLKNSNVSDAEAQEVTNKILEMSNHFRNEITDTTYKTPSYGSAESLWMQKQMFMQRLEREITDFMEKVLNESSSFYKDTELLEGSFGNQYNKFKHPLKTSTPTKSSSQDGDIEDRYKNKMKEIIKNWISNLQIDVGDECFKDDMAHDIATDIIDRERYMQLSKLKRSSQEALEHLKYQIFKWTSKLPKPIDITTKTADIKKLIESLEVLGIPDLIRNTYKQRGIENEKVDSKFSIERDGNAINQETDEFIEQNIYGAIWNWLNEKNILKLKKSEDKFIIDEYISELSNKLKNIVQLDPNTQVLNAEKLCKDEIVDYLKKLNHHVDSDEELEHRASELINHLKCLEIFSDTLNRYQDISQETASTLHKKHAIKNAVKSWCQKLPLKKGKTYDDMKDIVENLAEAVSRYLMISDMENVNTFMDEILHNLKKLPIQFDKEDSKHLPGFTERLIETLKGLLNDSQRYYSTVEDDSAIRRPFFKKAAEVMYDNIQNWCENLPLNLGTSFEDIKQSNIIKQDLVGKLLKKVGELNLDPEIFHDDYLYEDVLKDEIEKILNHLEKTKELEEVLPTLKENLVKDLLEAKEGMKNEIAGFAYKQQLRDAISKTLSSIGLTILEETPFEVLKENLADAFISLHYVADDEKLKRKFKDKIFNEVNKFCDDYLKRNPSTHLNAHQLNQELYNALKKVPVPKEESIRREVEQIRVKDIVADWFKNLPLQESPSPIQENKIVSILAKRLHEIENEAEYNPDIDIEESMNHEISKWLKKLKLSTENEINTESLKKTLINKLQSTKHDRKLDESTVRKSINYEDLTSRIESTPYYPPSSLSPEDRAHLQRIRDRTSISRASLKPDGRKDASVSPAPIATGMQTEENRHHDDYILEKISQNASIQTLIRDGEPPISITPQVIVKEYYWNSNGSPTMQRSGSILSCTKSPVSLRIGNIQQKFNGETPQASAASQTMPLPVSKATITQETEQVVETQIQNDIATTTSQQHISNEINIESQAVRYNPDDYLQLNSGNRAQVKSCRPCQGRELRSGDINICPDAGTSKALQPARSLQQGQDADEQRDFREYRPEGWTSRHNEGYNCLDDQGNLNPPCYRRTVCQMPTKEVECMSKRKRKSDRCTCSKPIISKCTIRPQSPCQHSNHSNKSCYVSRKHCPKCWDGFCPHPSYLYFRQD